MIQFFQFFTENWQYFVILILGCIIIGTRIGDFFFNKTQEEQLKSVKEWLLFAVAAAEKEFGGGTGQLKLRYVYNLFLDKFSFIAEFITFEDFSNMVDEVLIIFNKMLSSNSNVQNYIKQ